MQTTPLSLRTHVSIFGNTNSGKSALFNKLLDQDMSIVSDVTGTTTDPVTKAMELLPYGPIALTDTAGLGDNTKIGEKRINKTKKILDITDFAIYTADSSNFNDNDYEDMQNIFKKKNIEHMLVFTKSDLSNVSFKEEYPDALFVSINDENSIEQLRAELSKRLSKIKPPSPPTMIGDLLPKGSVVILVIPIDSEAPAGRLILPQVQFLRDCLDNGMTAICVRETELENAIKTIPDIALVVTDSQVFGYVSKIVPSSVKLTSFSMMIARQKGNLPILAQGCSAISDLKDGDKILMAEACTHNVSHEDIGKIKIPNLLKKHTGKELSFEYCVHRDFPENLSDYSLVIHCGGCMINSRTMTNRIYQCIEQNVPITNYGVVLAYINGILDRSKEIFGI